MTHTLKMALTAMLLAAVSTLAVSDDQQADSFTTEIDKKQQEDGKRDSAELRDTAVSTTIEESDNAMLTGETKGSDNQGNSDVGSAAGDAYNAAMDAAETANTQAQQAKSDASTAYSRAGTALNRANTSKAKVERVRLTGWKNTGNRLGCDMGTTVHRKYLYEPDGSRKQVNEECQVYRP